MVGRWQKGICKCTRIYSCENLGTCTHGDGAMNQLLLYGVPTLCCILCYWNSLKGQLVHDDIPAIQNNLDLRPERSIYKLFQNDYWGKSMSDNTSHKSYRPVTVLTFRLNYYIHGLDPRGFHVVNVLLHIITTCLVTHSCLMWVFKTKYEAFLAGCLFAVHPIHTEAVTSIVGRADGLCAVFFLLSLLFYQKFLSSTEPTSTIYFTFCCSSGAMAMLSKEHGITALAVCVLSGCFEIRQLKNRHCDCLFQTHKAVLLVWICILMVLRMSLMDELPVFLKEDNPASFEENVFVRMLNYGFLYSMNVNLMIYPWNLCHDWSYGTIGVIHGICDPRNFVTIFFLCFGVLLNLKALSSKSIDERRILQFGILIMVVPYIPASNIFFRVGFVIAERILYIPSIGFCILIVHSFKHFKFLVGAKFQYIVIAVYVIYALKAMIRNKDWTNRESLSRAGVLTFPHNAKLQYNYANVLRTKGLYNESIAHYKESIRLWPEYSSAHNNLATLLFATNIPEARKHLLLALNYNPSHANSHFNLANIAWIEGNFEEVISLLRKTLDVDRDCYQCHIFLSNIFQKIGKLNDSTQHLKLAEQLSSDTSNNFYSGVNILEDCLDILPATQSNMLGLPISIKSNLDTVVEKAELRAKSGDQATAIDLLTRYVTAYKKDEERARVYFLLGECYKDLGVIVDAINWFLQTIQLVPKHAEAHHNLAVAYHIQKNVTEAHHHYKAALALDPSNDLLLENVRKFQQLTSNTMVPM